MKINPCKHCNQDTRNISNDFCCNGCAHAFDIINKANLESYYRFRTQDIRQELLRPKSYNPEEQELVDKELMLDFSSFAIDIKNEQGLSRDLKQGGNSDVGMNRQNHYRINFLIQGIYCGACVWLIENFLHRFDFIVKARVNLAQKRLQIEYFGTSANKINDIVLSLAKIGYKLLPFNLENAEEMATKQENQLLKSLAVAAFGAGNVMLFSFALWFSSPEEMGAVMRRFFHLCSALISLPAIVFSSRIFFANAWFAIKNKRSHMDIPISIAIFLACLVSLLEFTLHKPHLYFDSAMMLVFFLLIGRYLEMQTRNKVFNLSSEFSLLNNGYASLINEDGTKVIAVNKIELAMNLLVNSGEKFYADGAVIRGESEIDNSLITGETKPQKISIGSKVYAGMINLGDPVVFTVEKLPSQSLIAEIIAMTENISNSKSYFVNLADRVAKYYTPIIHIIGLITLIYWWQLAKLDFSDALLIATAVLVISCPCALALAVPIAQTIFIAKMLKKGIVINSANIIEKLNSIDLVAFDKTGTLTSSETSLVAMFTLAKNNIVDLENNSNKIVGDLIFSVASNSNHLLSKAISRHFSELPPDIISGRKMLDLQMVKEIKGEGMVAKYQNFLVKIGNSRFCNIASTDIEKANLAVSGLFSTFGDETSIYCCFVVLKASSSILASDLANDFANISPNRQNNSLGAEILDYGVMFFNNSIKSDSLEVVNLLKNQGKELIIVSGDRLENVKKVADFLAIAEYYADLTPFDKITILQQKQQLGKKILMVGDGINDAPAIASAMTSVSFANGAEISKKNADAILQGNKIMPLFQLINSSVFTYKIMWQNMLFSLIYNAIAIPFAIAGYVLPLFAAIAMSSSSLLVLINSLRIAKNHHQSLK